MQRLLRPDLGFKGEITALLALIFILMLSVVGALIQSASIQVTMNRKRTDTMLALESVFAEFDVQMLEQYELFVRQGSDEALTERLVYYGATDMEHSLLKVEYLTDNDGNPFYRQAVRYMKDWLGLDELSFGTEYDFSDGSSAEEKERSILEELESLLQQEEAELPAQNNPIESVQNLKKSNLLSILVSDSENLSNRSISPEALPSGRGLQKGNYDIQSEKSITDKAFFVAYLLEKFPNMTNGNEGHALLYEQEYLLGGMESDIENLETVCKKILMVRTVMNYAYLLTDSTRKAEAEAMALTICSLLTVPQITELVKQGILLAWAYGESIIDVRVLLKGEKVPFVKNSSNWQLQLVNLVKLGTSEEEVNENPSSEGLGYGDYLKGLFLLESTENLSMRSLDLIESNLHIKTDQCMTAVMIKSTMHLQQGLQDTFTTSFEYQ